MTAIILDTETTGVSNPHATQIAYLGIRIGYTTLHRCLDGFNQKYNPQKPITYGSMAITGICDEDVKDCPPHTDFKLPEGLEYIIGHNIDYDCEVLANAGCDLTGIKRICTFALSRKYFPDVDSHSLGAMLYLLCYDVARSDSGKAHDAWSDVYFTLCILGEMIERLGITSLEQLYEMNEQARIPEIIGFGKHKGTPIKQLPGDYVAWLLKQPDLDKYLKKALIA